MKIEPACSVCCRPIHKFYYIDFVGDSIVKKYTCPQCKNEGVYIIHDFRQWRKRVSIIALLLTLYSCGYEVKTNDPRIDEVFLRFISYAEQYRAQVDIKNLSIDIANLLEVDPTSPNEAMGACIRYGVPIIGVQTSKRIVIDAWYWKINHYSTIWLEKTLFHELGHCALDINNHAEDGNLMGAYGVSAFEYKNRREELIRNLFKYGR